MLRGMRRFKQLMDEEEAVKILKEGKTGILAVQGEDGYPYTVPMNYVYYEGSIYFHGALQGHKMDAMRACDKVSFCVLGQDTPVPEKFTTRYSSIVAFGRAALVEDEEKKTEVMQAINRKYCPGYEKQGDIEIAKAMKRLAVVQISIDHVTGKASMEIINGMA